MSRAPSRFRPARALMQIEHRRTVRDLGPAEAAGAHGVSMSEGSRGLGSAERYRHSEDERVSSVEVRAPGRETTSLGIPALALGTRTRDVIAARERAERHTISRIDFSGECAGRDREVIRLLELYRGAEVSPNRERLVMLEGPSGIGKSRILAELRTRVRLEGGVVLEGKCEPGKAFGPFADIVERASRFLEEVGSAFHIEGTGLECRGGCHGLWHQHAEGHEGPQELDCQGALPEIAAFEKRMRFFDAIKELLARVSSVRTPVLMLHNLERADHGTLELLTFLLEGTLADALSLDSTEQTPFPLFVVASCRNDVEPVHAEALETLREHAAAERLGIGALDARGVRAFLSSEETIARVLARTGGNPELIERLLEADPLSPEAHVTRRLSQASPALRALLSALAVRATSASLDELARVAGLSLENARRADLSSCDLIGKSLLDGRIVYAFERENDREGCERMLSTAERTHLHSRATAVCAEQHDYHGAVRHALASGDHARAADLAITAAASLAARHAHVEAARLLESLLECSPEAPLAIREELTDLYRITGDYRAALVHSRALELARPGDANAALRVGYFLTVSGDFDEAEHALERAHASCDEARTAAEIEVQFAELEYQRGRYDASKAWAQQALGTAESIGLVQLEILARNTLGKLALAQKDASVAAGLFAQNRELAAQNGLGFQEAQALTNLGVASLLRRDLAEAEKACLGAVEVAVRASDTRERAIATENLAVLAHLRRDYRLALSRYHEAIALLKRLGNPAMLSRVANNLGELYLSLGDPDRARALSDLAEHVSGPSSPRVRVAQRRRLRGRIESERGNSIDARAHFEEALRIFLDLDDPRSASEVQLELARLALADGDLGQASEHLSSVEDDSPPRLAESALVGAELQRANGAPSLELAERAVSLADATLDDELRLRSALFLSRVLLDAGKLDEANRAICDLEALETSLSARVPDEARTQWERRPIRRELVEVQARLASLGPRRDATSERPSVAPGRNTRTELSLRAQQWNKRYPNLVGSSPAICNVFSMLDKVASSDALVLIRGESGTGKELIAEAIHRNSTRAGKPVVKVNCAALVETLLLSELFGHEKGAFTGAAARKKGRFEVADGGTIFLDEIGDISPKTQVALLRVLQEREFERVGGTSPIRVDVRIVAATHRDLEKMVREGSFREDLYYRLRGVSIDMPPLRKRVEDLPVLCTRLLERIALERDEEPKSLSDASLELLSQHRWPGNVRELENVLRSATLFAEADELSPDDFAAFAETFEPPDAEQGARSSGAPADLDGLVYEKVRGGAASLFEMKKQLERQCIVRALEETNGNITRAATLLGMKRPRLSQLVKEYELGHLGK